jgi:Predicted transcriptional regulators
MKEGPDIARVAALIGDPARANMLTALMAGKMLTAGELAREAGVTLPTASAHLAKLEAGGLVVPRRQGRHKYVALAGAEVAAVLEALMGLAAGTGHLRTRTGPRDESLRRARVCYNHLAGDMGIQMFESLRRRGHLRGTGDAIDLSRDGHAFLAEAVGIDIEGLKRGRTRLCRECLDWSARRPHLAGSVGRALLQRFEANAWARREKETRAVRFTREGERQFHALFPGE